MTVTVHYHFISIQMCFQNMISQNMWLIWSLIFAWFMSNLSVKAWSDEKHVGHIWHVTICATIWAILLDRDLQPATPPYFLQRWRQGICNPRDQICNWQPMGSIPGCRSGYVIVADRCRYFTSFGGWGLRFDPALRVLLSRAWFLLLGHAALFSSIESVYFGERSDHSW